MTNATSEEWYYGRDGEHSGPVSTDELRKLARTERLLPTDLVWKEGLDEWVPAAKVNGLFNELQISQWFYTKGGNQQGPVSWAELRRLSKSGDLQLTDMVWRQGTKEWEQASEVEGLIEIPHLNPEVKKFLSDFSSSDVIKAECPNCKAKYRINPEAVENAKYRCKACGHQISLPAATSTHNGSTGFLLPEDESTELSMPRMLTAEEITKVVNHLSAYFSAVPFIGSDEFQRQLQIESAQIIPVYEVVLTTLYEHREAVRKETPFRDWKIVPCKVSESNIDIWNYTYPAHDKFTEARHEHRVDDSQEVIDCGACQAVGQVTCTACTGHGMVGCPKCNATGAAPCPTCSGTGAVRKSATENQERMCRKCCGKGSIDPFGEGDVRRCDRCYGRGFRNEPMTYYYNETCGNCQGHKRVQCDQCQTTGQVITQAQNNIKFQSQRRIELWDVRNN